jgi:aminopeptidase-like protein
MHALARQLWPIDRSLTGDGVRETLAILQRQQLPGLQVVEVPSGTPAFDWQVPREWRVRDAWITTPSGRRICHFRENNLHLVGYSVPVRCTLSRAELDAHLHSLPEQPDAIPYVTSYYKERWGFCLRHAERLALEEGDYQVVIDSELFDGSLSYGELLLPGESEREVLLSTYVCHPSMANNELSGPVVTTFLAAWLAALPSRRLSYRIVFVPETIGSITYLSRHLDTLKRRVVAGFNISCVGDDRAYSYLPSRNGQTLSDQVARHVLRWIAPDHRVYTWRDRGSDERQYCAPGVDLPVASIMRTKYGEYPEYHTSLDDLERVVTPAGLAGGFQVLQRALEALEANERHGRPRVTVLGEPQLGRRGLYPTLSTKSTGEAVQLILDLLTWSDGTRTLVEIAELCQAPVWELIPLADSLRAHGLLAD